MPTDTERREVARRLRGLTSNVYGLRKSYESEGFSILCEEQADYYQICKAVSGYLPPEHMHPCDYEELHDRLADLVEPSDHIGDSDKMVDREALLALADDVDGAADDSGGFEPLAGMLRDIARRIRDALGVAS